MLEKVKEITKENIKMIVYPFLKGLNNDEHFFTRKNNTTTIYIIDSHDLNNLGDCAIVYAQKKLIHDYYPNYAIIEIRITEFYKYFKLLKKNIKKEDIITFVGGGNFGIEYYIMEAHRRLCIRTFSNNKIIMFPQTMYFGEGFLSTIELKRTQRIYNKHSNLFLFSRDDESYKNMKRVFTNCNVYLVPDIVFYLTENKSHSYDRKGVIICMRHDIEKKLNVQDEEKIENFCRKNFKSITKIDTVVKNDFSYESINDLLNQFWNSFSRAELIITDRLHGMIFSYITHTPCIAFDNYNNKVSRVYKWISNVGNIKVINDVNQLDEVFEDIKNSKINYVDLNFSALISALLV
ncbi:polysaccharide pyruvyl transferase family protein [Faecalicoccus acidiformans]|uniref:polysaccharide pyruvyl transferase family protein n=1 Tax=Faecalicoccus acidiformans TaxID=915173 RepID=UPI0025A3874F|nr:polysaccharide pyruvyl transferase family protein [Faecalicoccus acidiformans]MDM8203645.1 polysaccharide pyruvyl transferase family protein [Faecalicoccus acidiformans]